MYMSTLCAKRASGSDPIFENVMNSFTMKISVAQALAVHGLPRPPNPPWPLALLVQYWGLPHVPWYLCRRHGRGFFCELCGFRVGSYTVRPCTAAHPLENCSPASSQQSQPAGRAPDVRGPPQRGQAQKTSTATDSATPSSSNLRCLPAAPPAI